MGKDRLKKWFLAPLQDVDEIVKRQEVVSFFCEAVNLGLADQSRKIISKISNIPQLCKRLRVKSLVSDWKSLQIFLSQTIRLLSLLDRVTFQARVFQDVKLVN